MASVATFAWGLSLEPGPLLHAVTFDLAIVPAALYVLSILIALGEPRIAAACRLLQSHGRLALTHYLTQTVFGIALLPVLIAAHPPNAFEVSCLCIAICAGQIAFSQLWLRRFHVGPIEWLWRCATHMRVEPLSKRAAAP